MLKPADKIDLSKYLGKWYEVASFPFIFQRGCSNTTAEYSMKENGDVKVLNTCKASGKDKLATGSAKTSGRENVFRVGFPPFEFLRADYIILFVDVDYKYAVVGSTAKRYLWILARDYHIDPKVYDELVSKAKGEGYNVERIQRTMHCQECCALDGKFDDKIDEWKDEGKKVCDVNDKDDDCDVRVARMRFVKEK